MRPYAVLGILFATTVAYAAITGTVPSVSQPAAFLAIEGSTQELTLGPFTREDGETPVTPSEVAFRIDCLPPPASTSGATTVLLATQKPTPAETVVTTIPASKVVRCPGSADAQVTVTWKWWPGRCSTTTTTTCNVNGDCPAGQSCEAGVGQREAILRVKPRRFTNT